MVPLLPCIFIEKTKGNKHTNIRINIRAKDKRFAIRELLLGRNKDHGGYSGTVWVRFGSMELSKKKLWNFDYQGSSKNDLSSDLKVPMLGVNKIVFHERCLGTVLPWFA